MIKSILAYIARLLHLVFGNLTWHMPPWLNHLGEKAARKPLRFWAYSLGLLILLTAGIYTYCWYRSLPQPEQIIAQITPPKLTPVDKELIPSNLNIDFGIITDGELTNRAVAPLNLIGKEVTEGVNITPAIPGKWYWDTDSHLLFVPTIDWPAGQTYTITFAKDFFTHSATMASLSYTFKTLPFQLLISNFRFYQDPEHPQVKQAVATIDFSHPVDTASIDGKISLLFQEMKNQTQNFNAETLKYTINYDEHKRTAYVRSEALTLPPIERYLEIIIAKGIKPVTGTSTTTEATTAKILIPDAGSYFKIKNSSATIVRNKQDRPQQILALETSVGVSDAELNKAIHAYLLPKDRPATLAEEAKANYAWQDTGEVTADVLASATPLSLVAIPSDRDYSTLHSYTFNTSTPAYIYVKIDKGIHSQGNYPLSNDYITILKAPAYPQEISVLHKGALLALGTEEKLSILIRGLAAVKFDIARVLPDDVNHLITQTGGDFSNPYFINSNFNQNNISQIYSQILPFDASDPAKEQYTALDLGKYLTEANQNNSRLGLFLLTAQGWDNTTHKTLDVQTSRLILITDLGLIVKDNSDGTHDIFVQSIANGTPVANAKVDILGKNGVAILTRTTDQQGHTTFPTLNDFTNDRQPVVYIVKNGSDVSFIPYNRSDRQLNYSRFDVGGVSNNEENQGALTAYLFSDRGIYRPGDIAHIGMIVKQPYVMPQTAGIPLEVTITDPRGVIVKDDKLTLNEAGYLTLDFQTNETSPTGQYYINLYIVKDNHAGSLIGTAKLQVAEFLPDRLRIKSQLSAAQTPGWISPNGLAASVDLWNLYGAPAENHRVSGKIVLAPRAVQFKEYPDYTFTDPLMNPKAPAKVLTEPLIDTKTDNQGHATFDLKLDRFTKATYELTVITEGFEAEGGRSVTTQTTALVSPLAYLLGYKPDGDLRFIKQNLSRSVNIIAINPQLKQQALSNLKLQLFNLNPVTTLVKKEDGTYQYQSVIQTTKVSSTPFSIDAQGSSYLLPTQQIGDFLLTINDQNETELSRFKFSVVGASQQALPKNAELSVKLDKAEYAPGDDIEIQITSPYVGAGLITIERDKVYAAQWFKTNTTASVQKIHIPDDFQGDAYVNIAFVRDINSPEIFMSPLSYSVVPFSVSHKQHEIQVDLSTPSLARPGEPFIITYKTDKPGKIIVFAVDKGILQVTKFQSPDPLTFFFQKHALLVNTQQIVDQILPKFNAERDLSAVGGDNGEALLNKNLNPFKRKSAAPVVYWSGIIDTDSNERKLVYAMPDYFNGSIQVMAVAVASDAVGAATTSAEVRGNFVINANVPSFVAPGDEFDISASIANNLQGSGENARITIALLSTPQLKIVGEATKNIPVPEGQERSVTFRVKATSQLGSATLTLTASSDATSSKMASTLSVRPAIPFMTTMTSGYSSAESKSLTIDRILYPEYRQVEAVVSASPLILLTGLQNYLNDYPYGCTEQLVSKAMPLLAMANQPWFAPDNKAITDKIQKLVQALSQRQMSSGAFNYWPEVGTTASNDFATIYAMHFLTEARAQSFNIPSDIYSAGIAFLKEFVTQDISNIEQARNQAYAIYILTRNELVTTNYVSNLQLTLEQHKDINWHDDITSAYIAATYQLLKSSSDADKLIRFYKPVSNSNSISGDFYNQNIANAQYLYLIARHFPDRLKQIDNTLLLSLVNALNSDAMSTVLSGYTSLALGAYGQSYPSAGTADYSNSGNASITIEGSGNDNKQYPLAASVGVYQKATIDTLVNKITFKNPAKQPYFYQFTQAGFDENLPKQSLNQGLEVSREYRGSDNKPISETHLGDDIEVHIRLRAIDNQYHDNIAVVDLLPGGFEVLRDSLKNENMDYIDAREDRVLFFGSAGPDSKEIVYRIKATNIGQFTVPPLFAMSMYNPLIKSLSIADMSILVV